MTSAAQVKKFVRPLMERYPELALIGRMVVVPPVRHVLRGFFIDRTGEATRFKPWWFVMHLFEPIGGVRLTLGDEMYKSRPTDWNDEVSTIWWIAEPEGQELLCEVVEKTLPKLIPLRELDSYVTHLVTHRDYGYRKRPLQKVIIDSALGHLDDARAICRDVIGPLDIETFGRYDEDKARLRRAKEVCRLLAADDQAGLAALLHEWEATTVRNLKIEHLWEKTPFPLEDARPRL